MNECDLQIIGAYHDGELNEADARRVEQHLLACASCVRELEELREVSRLIGAHTVAPLSAIESHRLHDAIDAAADRPVWRLFGAISAVAASLIIVSCAWLAEMPRRQAESGATATVIAPAEAWERVAVTLQPDPIDHAVGTAEQMADASLAGWMLQGISTGSN